MLETSSDSGSKDESSLTATEGEETPARLSESEYAAYIVSFEPFTLGFLMKHFPHLKDEAVDVMQNANIAALKGYREGNYIVNSRTSYLSLIQHSALDYIRRLRTLKRNPSGGVQPLTKHMLEDLSSKGDEPFDRMYRQEERLLMTKAAATLTGRRQQIYAETILAGKGYTEIAHQWGTTEATVRAAQTRMLKALRTILLELTEQRRPIRNPL